MRKIKDGTWLHDLIKVYNDLGGEGYYKDVYPLAKSRREGRDASWTRQAKATIRRTVEDHAEISDNFKGGPSVFEAPRGLGEGFWSLTHDYLRADVVGEEQSNIPAYFEGLEGIIRERKYLVKSRNISIAEHRKVLDDYTCQACGYRLEAESGKFIIDVHHLNPICSMTSVNITQVSDLICLCPNCHRISHSGKNHPRSVQEIRVIGKSAILHRP